MTVEQIIQGLARLRDKWRDRANEEEYKLHREWAIDQCADELDAELLLLRERLGKVLEAGQAMRDDYGQTLEEDPCKLWDAALAALGLPAGAGRGEGQDHG